MVVGDILPDWLGDADLGTVPSWLAVGSLILAYVVFRRDRRNVERSQVALVSAWGEGDYEIKLPGEADVKQATIFMHVRNASELPVIVKQLAYEVRTRWLVEDREQQSMLRVYKPVDAPEPVRAFPHDLQLGPAETKDLSPFEVNVEHLAPDGSRQLDIVGGVTVKVAWLLIRTGGRRWVVKPDVRGGRAKRARWWWRPEEFMPSKW
jgi:hypothetical protein